MSDSYVFLLDFTPGPMDPPIPSINEAYTNGPHGRRILSKAGASFKAALTREVVGIISQLAWKEAVDAVYLHKARVKFSLHIWMPCINASWKPGAKTKTGLQSPYKKKDVGNYLKIVEDAVAEATGIDDSAHFELTIRKDDAPDIRLQVFYEVVLP